MKVVVVVILAAFCGVQGRNLINKVQDGKDIIEGSQALLKTYDTIGFLGYCGSTIVHPRFIFTAVQCVEWATEVDAAAGYKLVEDAETPWIHYDCKSINLEINGKFFFAMLIFIHPITGGNIAIASLDQIQNDVVEGETVYVPTYNSYGTKDVIKSMDVHIRKYQGFNREKCTETYPSLMNEFHFCYGNTNNNEHCEIDYSNGVYTEDGTLVGLTVFRDSIQCNAERPAISIRFGHEQIVEFLDFVMDENNTYNINCTFSSRFNKSPLGIKLHL